MRIGLLGGSFDPIHLGHLSMARIAQEEAGLDLVLFLPARLSPFKTKDHAPALDRWAMALLAIEEVPTWRALRWELERPEPSYSIDTVLALKEQLPEAELHWIIGADNLASLHKWHRSEELFALSTILVAGRNDLHGASLEEETLQCLPNARILQGKTVQVSSSEIRARLERGEIETLSDCLHPSTIAYIQRYGLYERKEQGWIPSTLS